MRRIKLSRYNGGRTDETILSNPRRILDNRAGARGIRRSAIALFVARGGRQEKKKKKKRKKKET